MDNSSQEKIISDSESQSLGSQDSWSSEDSQNSFDSFICDDSCSESEEEFWNGVEKFWKGKEERKMCK